MQNTHVIQSHILESLNENQRRAVLTRGSPTVVFAGAGSGKTRVIVGRIAHLITEGTNPRDILALTFTNKAAKEMGHRLYELLPNASDLVGLGTFHSLCARWLRQFASEIGFTTDYSIYDESESQQTLKTVLKNLNIDIKEHSHQQFKHAIERAKTMAYLPIDCEKSAELAELFPPHGVLVYRRYQEALASSNAMDFSDLLMNMLLLLRNNKRVRESLQTRYQHILVDEYQDTNATQFQLLNLLVGTQSESKSHNEIFVVGDDDQSIYSWRGADSGNILRFKQQFPNAQVIELGQNYRCSGNIVNAAAALIEHNRERAPKKIWTDNPPGESIDYRLEYDSEAEAQWIVETITSEKYSYADVAILYRTNAQSRQIEDQLRKRRVPYRIYGSLRFYDRVEIKDLTAYLKLLVNPLDDVSFRRILNVPTRGVGKKALDALEAVQKQQGLSLFECAKRLTQNDFSRSTLALAKFLLILTELKCEAKKVSEIIPTLLKKIDYLAHIEKKYPAEAKDKIGNIYELVAALTDFEERNPQAHLAQWLTEAALNEQEHTEDQTQESVCLMTLHSAKGLEFKRVFIPGVDDGLIPHSNSVENNLEEERRLFYVGMTRAGEKLTLISAQRRKVYNQWMSFDPSRFLAELPQSVFQLPTKQGSSSGGKVFHPTYGRGRLRSQETEFGVKKALVDFEDFGLRKIRYDHLDA